MVECSLESTSEKLTLELGTVLAALPCLAPFDELAHTTTILHLADALATFYTQREKPMAFKTPLFASATTIPTTLKLLPADVPSATPAALLATFHQPSKQQLTLRVLHSHISRLADNLRTADKDGAQPYVRFEFGPLLSLRLVPRPDDPAGQASLSSAVDRILSSLSPTEAEATAASGEATPPPLVAAEPSTAHRLEQWASYMACARDFSSAAPEDKPTILARMASSFGGALGASSKLARRDDAQCASMLELCEREYELASSACEDSGAAESEMMRLRLAYRQRLANLVLPAR